MPSPIFAACRLLTERNIVPIGRLAMQVPISRPLVPSLRYGPPTGMRRLELANSEMLAQAVDTVLHKLTQSHSPDVREIAHTWLALAQEGTALDVRSGTETARMLKTASPMLARKSEGEFAGALRAFRTTLGYELGKLGY